MSPTRAAMGWMGLSLLFTMYGPPGFAGPEAGSGDVGHG